MKLVGCMKEDKEARGWFVESSLCRSERFIDRETTKPRRRAGGGMILEGTWPVELPPPPERRGHVGCLVL